MNSKIPLLLVTSTLIVKEKIDNLSSKYLVLDVSIYLINSEINSDLKFNN